MVNPQSWNRYSYVQNNPIRYTDPSGHRLCEDVDNYGMCLGSYDSGKTETVVKPYFRNLPVKNPDWIQWFGATSYAHEDHLAYLKNPDNSYNYDGYCQGFHCGIDFGAPWGTPVEAGVYGTAVWGWNDKSDGGWKLIVSVGDYYLRYEHLASDPGFNPGDVVSPNTIIGEVGNPTGDVNDGNTHLHLEVRHSSTGTGDYKNLIENPLLFMSFSDYKKLEAVAENQATRKTVTFMNPFSNDPLQQISPIRRGGDVLWP